MKKFVFAILTCLIAVCAEVNAKEDVKFKNPIFYNRMILEEGGPDLILTPTWAKEDMHENGIAEGPCELLANEESYIVHICKISYPLGATRIYINKYEALYDCAEIKNITHPALNDDGLCTIKEYSYSSRTGKISGWSFYTVQKTK